MAYPFYLDFPSPADVILRKLDASPGGGTLSELTLCSQRGIPRRKERDPSGGAYQGMDASFLLPVALLEGQIPKPADQIQEVTDGTVYSVLGVDFLPIFQWYRLYCVNLSIYLPDTILIKRGTVAKGSAGGVEMTFTSLIYTLSARVQLTEERMVDERGLAGIERDYRIILPQQATINSNDVVVWNSQTLDIVRMTQASRIDEFPVLDARLPL